MTTSPPASALELARRIRQREVSASALVDHAIRQVVADHPRLNAVVVPRFEEARAEAAAADRRVREEPVDGLPPLLGVPCTIKEVLGFQGLAHTAGLPTRRDVRAAAHGTAVARFLGTGVIPLGLTNVPELAMWIECANRVYGRTYNPYDVRCGAGGSSGGEGAVIGSGAVAVGLGADIGGSIRIPACLNGVFGHKPTGGTVPGTGHWPAPENEQWRYMQIGPMARRAEDLMPLLSAIAGPDGLCQHTDPHQLGDPASVRMEGLRVLVARRRSSASMADALERATQALETAGARVEAYEHPGLDHGFDIWSIMLARTRSTRFREKLGLKSNAGVILELLRWMFDLSDHTLPTVVLALIEDLPLKLRRRAERLAEEGRELKADLQSRLGADAVLLAPGFARSSPRHHHLLLTPWQAGHTCIFNVMEVPVTSVPMGLDARGLPVGVQVAGGMGCDHVTIAVALELEKRTGGWVPPPLGTQVATRPTAAA